MSLSASAHILKLQDLCKKNVEKIKEKYDVETDYIGKTLFEAELHWLKIRTTIDINQEKFANISDSEKIDVFIKDMNVFYKEFPIVSRYMICMKKYSQKAFEKMLIVCKNMRKNNKSNEDIWIESRANYIKYIWEEDNKHRHYTRQEVMSVWTSACEMLKKDFNEFRETYDLTKEKVEIDSKKHKKELLFEMSNRIISGAQSIDEEKAKKLMHKLKDILYKQNYKKVLKEIDVTVTRIKPTVVGIGKNDKAKTVYDSELKQFEYKKNSMKMDIQRLIK